jgi:CMP-N-acetylneuraminic acid synthetase
LVSNSKKLYAFIFARGGSKGLPNKNILPFCGEPLIARTIKLAKSIKRIDKVIVSTDSEKIAKIALDYGAEVPFIRPANLAGDDSPEWLSWQHALTFFAGSNEGIPELFISIPVTAPLRIADDIERCINEYEAGLADVIVTVTDPHRNPYFNVVKSKADGSVGLVCDMGKILHRRQDAPKVMDMTTVAYVASSSFVLSNNSIFDGVIRAVHIPIERAIDIDTAQDFKFAQMMAQEKD